MLRFVVRSSCSLALAFMLSAVLVGEVSAQTTPGQGGVSAPAENAATGDEAQVFDLGRIVVVGAADGQPTVGGALLTQRPDVDRSTASRSIRRSTWCPA